MYHEMIARAWQLYSDAGAMMEDISPMVALRTDSEHLRLPPPVLRCSATESFNTGTGLCGATH